MSRYLLTDHRQEFPRESLDDRRGYLALLCIACAAGAGCTWEILRWI